MLRDLPKSVPSAVLSVAAGALEDTDDLNQRARDAKKAYMARNPQIDQHAHLLLTGMAQSLVEWGAMVQDSLPSPDLAKRFWTSGAAYGPCIVVASAEFALPSRPAGFPGVTLKTELSLVLDPGEGLFRHDDWLNGYRMTGGGLLNTAQALRTALHHEMLSRIHADVAEGRSWPVIEAGLARLVEAHKDR